MSTLTSVSSSSDIDDLQDLLPPLNPRTRQNWTPKARRLALYKLHRKASKRTSQALSNDSSLDSLHLLLSSLPPPFEDPAVLTAYADMPSRALPSVHSDELISKIFRRSNSYSLKHSPQELSLLRIVHSLAKELGAPPPKVSAASTTAASTTAAAPYRVLDIGGGNGNLAALVAFTLLVPVTIVERVPRRVAIQGELNLPLHLSSLVSRVVADVSSYVLPPGPPAIVLAKHLCGLGTDAAIAFAADSPAAKAAVLATCCCCKISESPGAFCDLHGLPRERVGEVDAMARATSWRNTALSDGGSAVTKKMLRRTLAAFSNQPPNRNKKTKNQDHCNRIHLASPYFQV
jgi:hypothetical protein